jgi:iron complex outermembrane receptor protein
MVMTESVSAFCRGGMSGGIMFRFAFEAGRIRRSVRCRVLQCPVSTSSLLALYALLATDPSAAQTAPENGQKNLPQISVAAPRKRAPGRPSKPSVGASTATPGTSARIETATGLAGGTAPPSPLNTGVVAESASRLGLTVRQTPASVDVIDQQTIRDQGYRTTPETVQGAVGVLSLDAAGAPAGFSMRGFDFSQVNVLYDGIKIGPQSFTSRVIDTANLDRVEFMKGPSSLMSGDGAIGGAVNYVLKQPTTGPIQNEAFISADSLGSIRSGFASSGSTSLEGLDYRIGVSQDRINSFIDDDHKDLANLSTRFNYRMSEVFKTFAEIEYRKDAGNSYWGTPVVPAAFAGPFATSGVVSGSAFSHSFNNNFLGPVTIDSRTLTTNYNVLDNFTGATELWLRGGFEWALTDNMTLKSQIYSYYAKRSWLDSETYALNYDIKTNTATGVDRDRFFVSHDQKVFGNVTDFVWNSQIFGMENRFVAQLAASSNDILFKEDFGGFPQDTVALVGPDRGFYGPFTDLETRSSHLDSVAGSFEERLKITPTLALIGGVRLEDLALTRNASDNTGAVLPNFPFTKTWTPVSYRAAYTWEPIGGLTFYSQYSTAFDPAVASIFSIQPTLPLVLTSSRIYETGVKQLFWGNKAEWTFSAFDIVRRNIFQAQGGQTFKVAGEIATKGVEIAAAVRPIDGWKIWGNLAFTHTRYVNFDFDGGSFSGNTPPNVAPIIANAGASYRYERWWWPVEIGASVRHVGRRYLWDDNAVVMDAYTVADAFIFLDFEKPRMLPTVEKTRLAFRVRNLTNKVYAAFSDPGYPDQIYLGAPRTYEAALSFKF